LRFDPRSFGLTAGDPTSRAWNLDVYTSWALKPKFSVYGRVGYEQPNTPLASSSAATDAARRQALGLNYGVGLRYDLNTAMGVRFEWARPYRSNGNASATGLTDTTRTNDAPDTVSVGIQFRF
jgi:opacity protein-like surface antigen